MAKSSNYHHGNLREALLTAGLDLLEEKGANGFSLRACAAKAGVSHSAPAHHFADMRALLTALATLAFEKFGEAMKQENQKERDAGRTNLLGTGRGYLSFARENPALFKLMFDAEKLDWKDEALQSAAAGTYTQLEELISALVGETSDNKDLVLMLVWSTVHGLAHLRLSGQMSDDADLDNTFLTGLRDSIIGQYRDA